MLRSTLVLAVLCCVAVLAQGFTSDPFRCNPRCKKSYNKRPKSVHQLTPCDIEVIGAIGGGDTAARFANNVDVQEYGYSFVTGSKFEQIDRQISLANILSKYNSKLVGFSTSAYDKGFNVAYTKSTSFEAKRQADFLVARMKASLSKDQFANGWKTVVIYIGENDACNACNNSTLTPENFKLNLEETLEYLQNRLPRTLVHLVLHRDVSNYGSVETAQCHDFLLNNCECAVTKSVQYTKFIMKINDAAHELALKFRKSNSFAVVAQPFLQRQGPPKNSDFLSVDHSFFASNCWHWSVKGQETFAAELWNNILQPCGQKSTRWSIYLNRELNCAKQYQYIPTK